MHVPAGEPPEQEAVDRAEREFSALGARARAVDVFEDPREFRAGEIGIEQETRALANELFRAVAGKARAVFRRAPVLPDDRAVDRPAGRALPHDGRLALVRDSDGRDVLRAEPGRGDRLACRRDRIAPDVLGVVFNPSGRRVVLRKLAPGERDGAPLCIEDDAARRGRALVDGENVSGTAHGSRREVAASTSA